VEAEEAEADPSLYAVACLRTAASGNLISEISVGYDVVCKILSRRERIWFMFKSIVACGSRLSMLSDVWVFVGEGR
jgi:hypothetical protein